MFTFYIIVIFIIFAVSSFIGQRKKQTTELLLVFLIASLGVFIVFRPDYVPDTVCYINYFENIKYSFSIYNNFTLASEIGFSVLNLITYYVFPSYRFLFFVIYIFNVIIIIYGYNRLKSFIYSDNITLSDKNAFILPFISLYFSYYGYYWSAIIIQNGIAISLLFLCLIYFIEKQYVISIAIFGIAILFHQSLLFAVFLFPIALINVDIKKQYYYCYLMILLVFFIINIQIYVGPFLVNSIMYHFLDSDYSILIKSGTYFYRASEEFGSAYSFRIIFLFISIFISVFFKERNQFWNFLLITTIFGLTLQVFFGNIRVFTRATDYYLFFSFILYFITFVSIKNRLMAGIYFLVVFSTNAIFILRMTYANS